MLEKVDLRKSSKSFHESRFGPVNDDELLKMVTKDVLFSVFLHFILANVIIVLIHNSFNETNQLTAP